MVEKKDKYKVLFDFDSDGYIVGWQQEFFDGQDWQTPFDTSSAVEMSQADIDGISVGATKLTDNKLIVDQDKIVKSSSTIPSKEQAMINALGLQVAHLQAVVKSLGGGASV